MKIPQYVYLTEENYKRLHELKDKSGVPISTAVNLYVTAAFDSIDRQKVRS